MRVHIPIHELHPLENAYLVDMKTLLTERGQLGKTGIPFYSR